MQLIQIRQDKRARVSLPAWHSSRLKRVVAGTGAAEASSPSAAVAEAQWLQVLWRDLMFHDVAKPDWHSGQAPFTIVLSKDCELADSASSLSVVDAKSVFDTLSRNSSVPGPTGAQQLSLLS